MIDFSSKNQLQLMEFVNFLNELCIFSQEKYQKSTNHPLIGPFLKEIEIYYVQQYKEISPYIQTLEDEVFRESRVFYCDKMQQFVDSELASLEFAEEFFNQLLKDIETSENLAKDVKKQANIELTPNILGFSNIILDFYENLSLYIMDVKQNFDILREGKGLEPGELPEEDYPVTHHSLLIDVKLALKKTNKYFTE